MSKNVSEAKKVAQKLKTKNRIISLLLAVTLIIGVFPIMNFTVSAAETLTVTIDNGSEVKLNDTDGDGYYEISTADELYAFAALTDSDRQDINVKLTDNITVNTGVLDTDGNLVEDVSNFREWTPISDTADYTGTFDGGNFTVSGI